MNLRRFCFSLFISIMAVALHAQSRAVMLTGVIADSAGNRLCGARVSVKKCNAEIMSGKDGIYHVSLPPGEYLVSVSLNGFEPANIQIVLPAQDFIEESFILAPSRQPAVPFIPGNCIGPSILF